MNGFSAFTFCASDKKQGLLASTDKDFLEDEECWKLKG
jgi:hypothetical protein